MPAQASDGTWTHGPRTAQQPAPPNPRLEHREQFTPLGFRPPGAPKQGAGLGVSDPPRRRSPSRPRRRRHRDQPAQHDRRHQRQLRALGSEHVHEHQRRRLRLDAAGGTGTGHLEQRARCHHRGIMMSSESPRATLKPTTSEKLAWAQWDAIGTTIRLLVTDATPLEGARAMLTDDPAALDPACSPFRPDSALIHRHAKAGQPTAVSSLLAGAVRAALRGALLTDGLVDP